jgi:hypothetical protein
MSSFTRVKLFSAAALALLGVLPVSSASADTITAKISTVIDAPTYGYKTTNFEVNGVAYTGAITGAEVWNYTSGTPVAQGSPFYTYCIEITQDVYLGSSYTFTLGPLNTAPQPGTGVMPYPDPVGTPSGMGTGKAAMIGDLWSRYYADSVTAGAVSDTTTLQEASAAFQVDVWAIVYDNPLPITNKFDYSVTNTADNFYLTANNDLIIGNLAQTWLTQVGDDVVNNNLGTANLIALTNSADQDQITVAAPLPSSASLGLALLGGLGLGGLSLRRRRPSATAAL